MLVWRHYNIFVTSTTHTVLFFSITEGHYSEQQFSYRARGVAIGTNSVEQGPSILAWLFHTLKQPDEFISGWQASSCWHTGVLLGRWWVSHLLASFVFELWGLSWALRSEDLGESQLHVTLNSHVTLSKKQPFCVSCFSSLKWAYQGLPANGIILRIKWDK